MHNPTQVVSRHFWRAEGVDRGCRVIPEETAIALTYNGGCYAVMMATPLDLRDFAIGFSINEGIVSSSSDFRSIEAVSMGDGIELRMWLDSADAERMARRRRYIAGPTGCGLCGIESIAEALQPCAVVAGGSSFSRSHIMAAMQGIAPLQKINMETRAVHAAAFWTQNRQIAAVREDVGRHNALDKLAGAIEQEGLPASEGMVLLTSRVSVEMVQKTAAIGAATLVSISAPTAAAVRMARAAGITLVAIARNDGFEVFTHQHRIFFDTPHSGSSTDDPKQAKSLEQAGWE
jgi:FdhD protein